MATQKRAAGSHVLGPGPCRLAGANGEGGHGEGGGAQSPEDAERRARRAVAEHHLGECERPICCFHPPHPALPFLATGEPPRSECVCQMRWHEHRRRRRQGRCNVRWRGGLFGRRSETGRDLGPDPSSESLRRRTHGVAPGGGVKRSDRGVWVFGLGACGFSRRRACPALSPRRPHD